MEPNHNIGYSGEEYKQVDGQFVRLIHERGYDITLYEYWNTEVTHITALMGLGDDIKYVRQLGNMCHVLVDGGEAIAEMNPGNGTVGVTLAANSMAACNRLLDRLKEYMPVTAITDDKVSMSFYYLTKDGPSNTNRKLTVSEWDDIRENYTANVRKELDWLMERQSGDDLRDGRLVLWRGSPGTGKTYALRALARAWKDWSEFIYVTDPEKFFGDAAYMTSVMLNAGDDEKWKVLILEDSGELLRPTAKTDTGQGLSRLLNMVDGILGQGMNFLVLVTTNEELKELHPAVQRNGRCASNLEFEAFNAAEAREWLAKRETEVDLLAGYFTVSELYAKTKGVELPGEKRRSVGFAA
jgi:hypothetical protein